MSRVDLVGAVALDAVRVGHAANVRGDAVDQQIADRIGREVVIIVAGEIRQLPVEAVRPIFAAANTPNWVSWYGSGWLAELKLVMPKALVTGS